MVDTTNPQYRHGGAARGDRQPEYRVRETMMQRCLNPNNEKYPLYGGRGVTVCQRWLDSYENFLADMGRRPSPDHSLDRYPNKDGNYEPDNCRWATEVEQQNNRRDNRLIESDGRTQTIAQWAREFKINYGTLHERLESGMSLEDAVAKSTRRVGGSDLTEDQVRAIRADGRSHGAIAADYPVSRSQVGNIKSGKSWPHVK